MTCLQLCMLIFLSWFESVCQRNIGSLNEICCTNNMLLSNNTKKDGLYAYRKMAYKDGLYMPIPQWNTNQNTFHNTKHSYCLILIWFLNTYNWHILKMDYLHIFINLKVNLPLSNSNYSLGIAHYVFTQYGHGFF